MEWEGEKGERGIGKGEGGSIRHGTPKSWGKKYKRVGGA